MTCTEPRVFVDAHLDRELDLTASLDLEAHMRECAVCSETHEAGRRLRSEIAASVPYFRASAGLRRKLTAAVGENAPRRSTFMARRWRSLGTALAAAAVLAIAIVPRLSSRGTDEPSLDEIVSGHVRSLMADHLTDVTSTDKHTVKPWFDGKLDFAPVVIDLADHGFPLVGGRLDYLGARPVAALVYGRQRHFINLFESPGPAPGPRSAERRGFHVVRWSDGGTGYWVVSDLNEPELREFAELLRSRASAAR